MVLENKTKQLGKGKGRQKCIHPEFYNSNGVKYLPNKSKECCCFSFFISGSSLRRGRGKEEKMRHIDKGKKRGKNNESQSRYT